MASSANLRLRHDSTKVLSMTSSYTTATTSSPRSTSFSSFSSSSSSSLHSSHFLHDSPLAPPSPTPLRFFGVPFSWEYFPGIPKKQNSKKLLIKDTATFFLPLPPPTRSKQVSNEPIYRDKNSGKKKKKKKKRVSKQSIERDPFFDALVECSKDDGRRNSHRWNHIEASKVSTTSTLGHRICSAALYASCKRTCATAESSIVHLPNSFRSSTSYYGLIHGRCR